MNSRQRSTIVLGMLLILIGLLALFGLGDWLAGLFSWPLIIVGVAGFLILIGLLTRTPAMAIPACVVGGIGLLLWWQNATGHWDTWSYAWALIPGFVGVGIVLEGLLSGQSQRGLRSGGWLIVISLVLFAVFGSFLGNWPLLGRYWPLLLVGLGLLLLWRSYRRPG